MTPFQIFASGLNIQFQNAHSITLISHRSPDGDALGSLEGMRWLLQNNYPHLVVEVVVPPELTDPHIVWILGKTQPCLPQSTDLVLLLDTSLLTRTSLPVEAFNGYTVISIDHHEDFAEAVQGYRDNTAPSNTIILTEMAEFLGWTIDSTTATALLMGVYTDTGGFIHRNTDARALSTAARLLDLWGDQSAIAQKVFGSYSLDYIHQLGQWLLAIEIVDRVAILCLSSDIEWWLKSHIIGYLSGLENVDIACVLRPEDDVLKGSLRTRYDHVDVNQIAQRFGGGGHKKAAWFRTTGSIIDGKIHLNGQTYTPREFVTNCINTEYTINSPTVSESK